MFCSLCVALTNGASTLLLLHAQQHIVNVALVILEVMQVSGKGQVELPSVETRQCTMAAGFRQGQGAAQQGRLERKGSGPQTATKWQAGK
jgi:transcription initiation factor TFIID subunit TAF12